MVSSSGRGPSRLTRDKLAAVPRAWLVDLARALEPLWREHQRDVLLPGEVARTPDYRMCRFTACFVARALTQKTGEAWTVAGGSPYPPCLLTGGFRAPDGQWAGHYWATNGRVIVDLAARQFGEGPVVIATATDPRYRRNYAAEEVALHLQAVSERVASWESRISIGPAGRRAGAEALDAAAVQRFATSLRTELALEELSLMFRAPQRTLHLSMLLVPRDRRNAGVGTAAMRRILALADRHQLRLSLSPDERNAERGTTSKARLVRWYKELGFVENKGRHKDYSLSETMYREPADPRPAPRRPAEDEGPAGP